MVTGEAGESSNTLPIYVVSLRQNLRPPLGEGEEDGEKEGRGEGKRERKMHTHKPRRLMAK